MINVGKILFGKGVFFLLDLNIFKCVDYIGSRSCTIRIIFGIYTLSIILNICIIRRIFGRRAACITVSIILIFHTLSIIILLNIIRRSTCVFAVKFVHKRSFPTAEKICGHKGIPHKPYKLYLCSTAIKIQEPKKTPTPLYI